jgi:hypothetical protein
MSTSFKDSLMGTKGKFEQFQTLTPQQKQLFSQLIGGLGGQTGQGMDLLSMLMGGDQQFLEQMQAPALRQFNEQIIPGIAERFTGAGAGAQGSSAFTQALGGAGADLTERLAGQRAGMGMQAQQSGLQGLLHMLGLAQQPQFGTAYQPGQQGALGGLFGGLGQGLGMMGGGALGGIGSLFGSLFKKQGQGQAGAGASPGYNYYRGYGP